MKKLIRARIALESVSPNIRVTNTLQALPPVFLIPISYFFFKEKISFRAITGTVIALAGVVALFLV